MAIDKNAREKNDRYWALECIGNTLGHEDERTWYQMLIEYNVTQGIGYIDEENLQNRFHETEEQYQDHLRALAGIVEVNTFDIEQALKSQQKRALQHDNRL